MLADGRLDPRFIFEATAWGNFGGSAAGQERTEIVWPTVITMDASLPLRQGEPGSVGDQVNSMHESFMQMALREAELALEKDEVPVGAVIVHRQRVVASAHNQREQLRDPTAHAEMIAITQAAESLGSWRLDDCTLYVTLEPCPMCAGAVLQARIAAVVYGADDPKAGAVRTLYRLLEDSRLNHRCQVVSGVLAEPCGRILTGFFEKQRRLGKK
jgi:tRNA(adenine34) deaminase